MCIRDRVTTLTNGNYVVATGSWDNGGNTDAGAVTWGSGLTGVVGPVSVSNSLVGTSSNDRVGVDNRDGGVTALSNGNYVVQSQGWDNGAATSAGAVTWASGTSGITGPVTAANSLVGTTAGDGFGSNGFNHVVALTNGNYVAVNHNWDNGLSTDVGAITWGNGTTGILSLIHI